MRTKRIEPKRRSVKPKTPARTSITLEFSTEKLNAIRERAESEGLTVKAFMLEGIQIRFEYKKVSKLIEIDSSDRFPFGKYKDVKLRDVPSAYLLWAIAENVSVNEDFRERIRQELATRRTAQEAKGA
jgi:hypothetical protein